MNRNIVRARLTELVMSDYQKIRSDYRLAIFGIVKNYLESPGKDYRSAANKMKKATTAAYIAAARAADKKAKNDWVKAKIALIFLFIAKLWEDLWQLKQEKEQFEPAQAEKIANQRADGYSAGLDGVFSESKVRRAGDLLLTFDGIDGKPPEWPCETCDGLKGQTHPARWWVENGLVPFPGNTNFVCGGWGCKHGLFDQNHKQFTL